METVLFTILAGFAVVAALATITRRSTLMSALWLVGCLVAVAGIFALLAAPLLAALQVLIAAGAVMVLFLFVVMLVDLGKEGGRARAISFGRILGAMASGYLALILALAIWKPPFLTAPASGPAYESPLTLAQILFSRYAAPFELVGAMMLVAVVAAIVLAKKPEGREGDA